MNNYYIEANTDMLTRVFTRLERTTGKRCISLGTRMFPQQQQVQLLFTIAGSRYMVAIPYEDCKCEDTIYNYVVRCYAESTLTW